MSTKLKFIRKLSLAKYTYQITRVAYQLLLINRRQKTFFSIFTLTFSSYIAPTFSA